MNNLHWLLFLYILLQNDYFQQKKNISKTLYPQSLPPQKKEHPSPFPEICPCPISNAPTLPIPLHNGWLAGPVVCVKCCWILVTFNKEGDPETSFPDMNWPFKPDEGPAREGARGRGGVGVLGGRGGPYCGLWTDQFPLSCWVSCPARGLFFLSFLFPSSTFFFIVSEGAFHMQRGPSCQAWTFANQFVCEGEVCSRTQNAPHILWHHCFWHSCPFKATLMEIPPPLPHTHTQIWRKIWRLTLQIKIEQGGDTFECMAAILPLLFI